MGGDDDIQIAGLHAEPAPDQAIPQCHPMQMAERGYHKRIKGEGQSRYSDGEGCGSCPLTFGANDGQPCRQPSEKKTPEIEFYQTGDDHNQPGDHDGRRDAGVRRVP